MLFAQELLAMSIPVAIVAKSSAGRSSKRLKASGLGVSRKRHEEMSQDYTRSAG